MRAMIEYLDYISSVAVHILVFLLGMMLLKQVVTSCCTFITTASSMNFNFAASHTCSLAHRKQVHVHVVEDGDNNNNVVTVFDSLLSPSQSKSTGQHSNHTLSHARHIVVTVLSYRYTKDVCIFVMLYLWLKHVIFPSPFVDLIFLYFYYYFEPMCLILLLTLLGICIAYLSHKEIIRETTSQYEAIQQRYHAAIQIQSLHDWYKKLTAAIIQAKIRRIDWSEDEDEDGEWLKL